MAAEVNSSQGPAKTSWCYWSLNWALRAGFSGLDTKMESLHLSDALTKCVEISVFYTCAQKIDCYLFFAGGDLHQ